MWQFLSFILLAAVAIYAIQLAIFILILAGLIFRTKETIGLLLIGGMFTLIAAHPVLGIGALVAVVTIGLIFKSREEKSALPIEDPDQE